MLPGKASDMTATPESPLDCYDHRAFRHSAAPSSSIRCIGATLSGTAFNGTGVPVRQQAATAAGGAGAASAGSPGVPPAGERQALVWSFGSRIRHATVIEIEIENEIEIEIEISLMLVAALLRPSSPVVAAVVSLMTYTSNSLKL